MGLRDFKSTKADSVKEEFDKYKDLDQDELTALLLKRVQQSKANGTFDKSSLFAFAQTIAPRLSEEQRRRLFEIIEAL